MNTPISRAAIAVALWLAPFGAAAALAQPIAGSPTNVPAKAMPSPAVTPGPAAPGAAPKGYYRQPSLRGDQLLFVAEGDVWKVPVAGGVATRLTSHAGEETTPAISPDGQSVAFTAQYEGPTEVYTMPLAGGLPTRLTYDNARVSIAGWTPSGEVLISTNRHSTLPNYQLVAIKPGPAGAAATTLLELAQASDGCFDSTGKTVFFTRQQFQGSATKRYKGGTAQQLWKFTLGQDEAAPLSADFDGTSKHAMWMDGRVYFLTDRDGAMNIWSMTPDGQDRKQHTTHKGLDVQGGSASNGRIVYQLGADLWMLDVATGKAAAINITLDSDLDQMRERWVEKPIDYATSVHLSPDGDRVVIVARGRIFVAPHRQGRLVDVCRDDTVRYRDARFAPDGNSIIAFSDKTGEVEIWRFPANGVGSPTQLSNDSTVLRWEALSSPDGKLIAFHDKNQRMWVFDVEKKLSTQIDSTEVETFEGLTWSADSRWLAYSTQTDNMFRVVRVYSVDSGKVTQVTTDRYDSFAPAWSGDGNWLFFLSDRTLRTLVNSPWGSNQPDPFLDETTKIYALALRPGLRWPFLPKDELQAAKDKEKAKEKDKDKEKEKEADKPAPDAAKPGDPAKPGDTVKPADQARPDDKKPEDKKSDDKADKSKPKKVEIVLEGLRERVFEVPIAAGNYAGLLATEKALFYLSTPASFDRKNDLMALEIKNDGSGIEAKTVLADVASAELSGDGKKLLVRKKDTLYIADAAPAPLSDLDKKSVNLGGWSLSLVPRQQWRQMFIDSWRLMRDYFYDPDMHGVNWRAMLDKYLPLVERVTTRVELNDLIAQMVGELSALHTFVRGGDTRDLPDNVPVAALGGELVRDQAAGGWRIARIYQCEPDDPSHISPLARPEVAAKVGDVILTIDGIDTLSVPDYATLLRRKADKQVLIRIKPAKAGGEAASFDDPRDAIIVPISQAAESSLRYTDWEYTRRLEVDKLGDNRIGYLHLRAMGGGDFTDWVKGFYPVFTREGLIIDVRHNRGGNIDSWILGKLLRKAWFYWSSRVGNPPAWNMQYAFRGHVVVLCNESTASDGEAFAEGFRRLGLGKVIGTRTWGGEIWLSSSNVLVDKGLASAAETGVWGPEGQWLIEGRGVEPDITVDNLPHSTFKGEDAQLKAAIEHLKQLIKDKPLPPMNAPKKPDKSFENK